MADGVDDGAGIVSATIAICERAARGRAYSRCLCGLRGNSKLVASRAAALLVGFLTWLLDAVSTGDGLVKSIRRAGCHCHRSPISACPRHDV